jgi:hypothetical protein
VQAGVTTGTGRSRALCGSAFLSRVNRVPRNKHPVQGDTAGPGFFVACAHRLEAFKTLQRETIPATVFTTLSVEESRLLELRENLDRNDLTGAERKAFAAEVGRLIAKLHSENPIANGNEKWLINLATETGQPTRTMYNWWSEFCRFAEREITPRQATEEQQDQFFNWLADQQTRKAQEKALQVAEEKTQQREVDHQDLRSRLDTLAAKHGVDVVRKWVEGWGS